MAANFNLGNYADDLFEACACYFPITFRPPPNDPYGVTQEGLILGLRRCLHASPQFAKPCFELLLDKESSVLDETKVCACMGPGERGERESSSPVAGGRSSALPCRPCAHTVHAWRTQVDSLLTMADACATFPAAAVIPFLQ